MDITFQRRCQIDHTKKFKVDDQKLVRCLTHTQAIKRASEEEREILNMYSLGNIVLNCETFSLTKSQARRCLLLLPSLVMVRSLQEGHPEEFMMFSAVRSRSGIGWWWQLLFLESESSLTNQRVKDRMTKQNMDKKEGIQDWVGVSYTSRVSLVKDV